MILEGISESGASEEMQKANEDSCNNLGVEGIISGGGSRWQV